MADIRVSLDEILPIKEAARTLPRAVDRLVSAETSLFVITRRSRPTAVLITLDRFRQLLQLEAEAAA
jgi:PHD/YefM family antitoxin component YafN of YafNO toxin-antitoxin module